MRSLIGIIGVIVMWLVARAKGFNPWCWFMAAGIPGMIVLLCMPSAASEGLDEEVRSKRRNIANRVGVILTVICVIVIVGLIVWMLSTLA